MGVGPNAAVPLVLLLPKLITPPAHVEYLMILSVPHAGRI